MHASSLRFSRQLKVISKCKFGRYFLRRILGDFVGGLRVLSAFLYGRLWVIYARSRERFDNLGKFEKLSGNFCNGQLSDGWLYRAISRRQVGCNAIEIISWKTWRNTGASEQNRKNFKTTGCAVSYFSLEL